MLIPVNLETHRFVVYVLLSFSTSFQVLKRLQRKDGGRPQRGGQERGDMENQEADKKFGSCPRVSNIFELRVGLVVGKTTLALSPRAIVLMRTTATAGDWMSGAEFGSG